MIVRAVCMYSWRPCRSTYNTTFSVVSADNRASEEPQHFTPRKFKLGGV